MVSRPTTDRQILDLENAESATKWILSIVAKCRAERKEDKINTDGTVQDIQVINYVSPKERVVTAEKAEFLSVIQGVGDSDDDFLERLGKEARYCDFEKLKTAANLEEELVKINLPQV